MRFRPCWSRQTEARLAGLSLAREAGLLLAWDASQRLYLWDLKGRLQATHAHLLPIQAAAISDEGRHAVVLSKGGELWWLDGRLQLQFDLKLDFEPLGMALEPLGGHVVISDRRRRTHLLSRQGKVLAVWETIRPLHFLSFVPSKPVIVGAADYGFIASFDAQGQCLWRDAPLSSAGSLSIDGEGKTILLACYSRGIEHYDVAGKHLGPIATSSPCRLVSVDYDGTVLLTAGDAPSLSLLKLDGTVLGSLALPHHPVALALGALGEMGAYGVGNGEVTRFDLQPPS